MSVINFIDLIIKKLKNLQNILYLVRIWFTENEIIAEYSLINILKSLYRQILVYLL